MSALAPDPGLAIPNDDERCPCVLNPGVVPVWATWVTKMTVSDGYGGTVDVALHTDCVHHGGIARRIRRSGTRGLSGLRAPAPAP